MKIALICTEKLPVPPVSGGAIQIYIEGILPFLTQQHDITVFSVQSSNLPVRETNGNISHVRVSGKSAIEYLNNLKKEISDEYDIVHVFNRPLWVLPLSGSAPDSLFSLSLHNEMFLPEKISPEIALKCIERVSFITTVSQFIADGVLKLYPSARDKLNVVYSGVDVNEFKPHWFTENAAIREALRKQYDIENRRVVLFVGRLGKKKGAHILLKAMNAVAEKNDDVVLMFVGSKWYGKNETDEYIKKLQQSINSLKYPVIFTGFLPPSEIPEYYCLGDIFVCSSQWMEPLARVHYEAMAAGLPIITTNRGGNSEVIVDYVNGLVLTEYNNPDAMAEKICYLLDHKETADSMGRIGRKLAESKYTWNRVANQLLELFNSVR